MGNIVSTITNAWNRAGGILNKLNPFSSFSFSMPFSADTAGFASPTSFASIAPMSADMPTLARGFAPMASFASTGGFIGDAINQMNKSLTGNGLLSNLPNVASDAMSFAKGLTIMQPQQEIKNEVTFHTTVNNERDLDKMFEKADDWFAQKGQMLNIGVGRR